MNQLKMLQVADLHFSVISDKLEEVRRCSGAVIDIAEKEEPDVIVVAGDSFDEYDGKIRIDSDTAREATYFIQRLADTAPVIIIRGTESHDRETPWLFSQLRARYPIYVSSQIEQIALVKCSKSASERLGSHLFIPISETLKVDCEAVGLQLVAAFTLIPSINKAYLMGKLQASISEANLQARELMRDIFAGLGLVNKAIEGVPRIGVIHGTCTGAEFSNGQIAIGNDLEFSLDDLVLLDCDYIAMGHVHKMQCFKLSNAAMACYSGSIGRLNFGELEEKGFLMPHFEGRKMTELKFFPTPARRFAIHSVDWVQGGTDAILAEADKCAANCEGADVRFRYTLTAEDKHTINKGMLEKKFLDAGARKVKIEFSILPKTRTRSDGISKMSTIPEKLNKWGESIGEEIPQEVIHIASTIEGKDIDELVKEAMARIEGEIPGAAMEAASYEIREDYGDSVLSFSANDANQQLSIF